MPSPLNPYTPHFPLPEPLNTMGDVHPRSIQHPSTAEPPLHSPSLHGLAGYMEGDGTAVEDTTTNTSTAAHNGARIQHPLDTLQHNLEIFRNTLRHNLGLDAEPRDISGIWPTSGGVGDDRVRPFESSYDSRFGAGYGGGNGEDFGESEGDAPRWEDGWELVDERNGIWLDVDTLRIGLGLDPPGHAFDADRVEGSGDGDVDGGDLSSRGLSDSDEEEEEDDDIVLARMMSTMDGQLGERVPVVEVDAADGSVERGRGRRCSWPRLGRRSGPERQEVTAESSSTSQPARDPSGTLLNGSVSSSRRDDSTAENPSPSGRRVQFADLPTRAESTSRHGDGASSAAEHIEYSSTGHHHGLDSGYQRHYSATYQHDNRHLWDEDLTRGRSRERRADRVGGNSRALPSTRTYAAVAQAGMDRETREATASERPVVGSGGFDDDDEDLQRAIALSLMD